MRGRVMLFADPCPTGMEEVGDPPRTRTLNPEIKRLGQSGTKSKLWSVALAGRLLPLTKSPNGRDASTPPLDPAR
jgi:hypothetical protein